MLHSSTMQFEQFLVVFGEDELISASMVARPAHLPA